MTDVSSGTQRPDVSVVIPFRNRETGRLERAIESLRAAGEGLDVEVIVSDFGSDPEFDVPGVCARTGARHVFTESDHWSRSACLNRGISAARGRLIQSDDADMLWTPGTLTRHARPMLESPDHVLVHQVWDLPKDLTEPILSGGQWSWEQLRARATSHARFGHGLALMPAEAAVMVNGYDERMHTYGVEDLDLTQRLRKAGYPIRWAGHDRDELFHIWHVSTSDHAKTDPRVKAIVEQNRHYYYKDPSYVRNVHEPGTGVAGEHLPPLVTVALASKDRAEMLREALTSVLCQTFRNFELIVADDGSSDHTREVVEGMDDSRVRYLRLEGVGISGARNAIIDASRGVFTAVLDDDDLMVPHRLAVQLSALEAGQHGTVGNFVNFDNETGELVSWGCQGPSLEGAFRTGGFAGHPTWLVRTDWLRAMRYDESLTSSVDNNIALRMLRGGAVFGHCGEAVTLRRRHHGQVTGTDGDQQKVGARLTHAWTRAHIDPARDEEVLAAGDKARVARPTEEAAAALVPYLPDHLVHRSLVVEQEVVQGAGSAPGDQTVVTSDENGPIRWSVSLPDATWADIAQYASAGVPFSVAGRLRKPVDGAGASDADSADDQAAPPAAELLRAARESARREVLRGVTAAQVVVEVPSHDVPGVESDVIRRSFSVGGESLAAAWAVVDAQAAPKVLAGLGGAPFSLWGLDGPVPVTRAAALLDEALEQEVSA